MAIGADSAVVFFGTTDEVISVAGAAVTDGSFSDTGDNTEWTNDDDAPIAMATLDATMASSPDAGSVINLYAQLMNVSDTTQDSNVPSTTLGHTYLGSFPMDSAGTAQIVSINIALPMQHTSQEYDFYLENRSGQSINTGSTVDITPITYGPHA